MSANLNNCAIVRTRAFIATLVLLTIGSLNAIANRPFYMLETGIMGGTAYYVGDLHEHIFIRPQYAAGLQFSYHFDRRWTITAKSQFCEIAFDKKSGLPNNRLINTDICAEFNFFKFDLRQYDPKIKPITPYIAVGFGMSIYGNKVNEDNTLYFNDKSFYVPFVLGMKWKMAKNWTMNIAWQHQVHFGMDADKIENSAAENNTYKLNKSNIIKNDLVSTLTLGITFAFARKPEKCRLCKDEKPKKIEWEQRIPRD